MKRYKARLAMSCFLSYFLPGQQILTATSNQKSSVRRDLDRLHFVTFHHRFQGAGKLSQGARSEQTVIGRDNQISLLQSARTAFRQGRVFAVAGEKIHARYVVAGDEALNLVENCHGIQWAQLRFE